MDKLFGVGKLETTRRACVAFGLFVIRRVVLAYPHVAERHSKRIIHTQRGARRRSSEAFVRARGLPGLPGFPALVHPRSGNTGVQFPLDMFPLVDTLGCCWYDSCRQLPLGVMLSP